MFKLFVILTTIFIFSGCSAKNPFVRPTAASTAQYNEGNIVEDCTTEIRASNAIYKSTMKPYKVKGRWYYPVAVNEGDTFIGKASWYGPNFNGKLTSNGERYNMHKRTAASKTLPINTYVRVVNLNNGQETVVRINDRGPFVEGRIIDLSYQAAKEIGVIKKGVVPIKLEVVSHDDIANRYAQAQPAKIINKTKSLNAKDNRYFVQIASIYDKSKAVKLKRQYASKYKNHRSYLVAKDHKSKKIYKLLIGRFPSKEDAKNFIKGKNFKNAFVVKD